jgi:hypothetical protein
LDSKLTDGTRRLLRTSVTELFIEVQSLFDRMTLPLPSLPESDPEQIHISFELTLTLYGGVDTVTPAA